MPHKFSILIVEDDDDARSNMEDIFSLDGYATVSASHCLEAINAIGSRHFDAIVIDWRLPDGSGEELFPVVKRALPDSPIIVVTGVREFDTAVTALRSGAYDFLTKPINPDALRALLARLVERKRHLAEIESAQEKLVASERLAAIGQMVAGLAHESRNALQRSHACLAELSLDLEEMPESLVLVQKVQRALDDLHNLLEEVREYSAPIILDLGGCDLEQLIVQAWEQVVAVRPVENPREFTLNRSDGFPSSLKLDPHRIQQVVRNLLENALDSSHQQILVELEAGGPGGAQRCGPRSVRLAVADDGDGVPDDRRRDVFTPFYTTKTKGTGLGLAISQRIVEAHGGRITIEDGPLGGARFVVFL